ncbi:MAG: 50S ribosomal protein L25 [Patescibacteria group bacterium]|nr:50S ribosomal protein L25 [Patescibacteria group bacterium]MCL5431669.1 50S ribosomal protein L25 [Patescibacteria group bacterium]
MKAIVLEAKSRSVTGKKVRKLRREGLVPASVYGKDVKSAAVTVAVKDFLKVYDKVGETGLVDLKIGEKSQPTLVANVQIHPLTRQPLHVEFHAVKLTEKIKANVPVELIGESPAVSSNTGVLLQTINEVEVEALPTDLPENLSVDVTKLSQIDEQVTVGELKIPAGVEVLTGKGEVVVKVAPAISQEAQKEAQEKAAAEAAKAAEAAAAPPPAGGPPPEAPKEEAKKE